MSPARAAASGPPARTLQRAAPDTALSAPAAVLKAFDSLLDAGKFPEARRLCTGQMLRMFDFIAMAQAKMADAVDTARSKDETLEEKSDGAWAYLKVSSHIAFSRPVLGQKEMRSIQAIHLYHARRGWLIAEMEELDNAAVPVHLRTGVPAEAVPGPQAATLANPDLFPVSEKAPAVAGEIDRMRYRLRLKNGDPLAPLCTLGPDQVLIRAESPSQWILENRRPVLAHPDEKGMPGRNAPAGPPSDTLSADSLRSYLASDTFLDLSDTLLVATASRIAGAETDPAAIAGRIYAWVTAHFHFELGAVLFGTSREVLRGMAGDCSEAGILTAALLRARGVPSRLALGFASVGRGVFIGHAWAEARIEGRWVGVDAALRQFPAGVERVRLGALDGKSDMRVSATNLMLSVLSNLDIEILSAARDGKSVALRRFEGNAAEGGKFFEDILRGLGSR